MKVFKNMLHELAVGRENPDGADQGFLASYFPDLLDQPMFHPPANGTKLDGNYRLPLGYQMDASYYCEYDYRYYHYSIGLLIFLAKTDELHFFQIWSSAGVFRVDRIVWLHFQVLHGWSHGTGGLGQFYLWGFLGMNNVVKT